MGPTCKSCKFFFNGEYCRRYPPFFQRMGSIGVNTFVPVGVSDFCGEYKRKPKQEKVEEPKTTPKSEMDTVITTYVNAFMDKFGKTPAISGKDRASVKRAINNFGCEETCRFVESFIKNPPDWVSKGGSYTISGALSSAAINKAQTSGVGMVEGEIINFLRDEALKNKHNGLFKSHLWYTYVDKIKKSGEMQSFKDYLDNVTKLEVNDD